MDVTNTAQQGEERKRNTTVIVSEHRNLTLWLLPASQCSPLDMMSVTGKVAVKPRSIGLVDDIYGVSGGGGGGCTVGGAGGGGHAALVESGIGLLRSTSARTKSLALGNRHIDELCTAIGGFTLVEKLNLKDNK